MTGCGDRGALRWRSAALEERFAGGALRLRAIQLVDELIEFIRSTDSINQLNQLNQPINPERLY
ncbi:hypothetical protein D1AOALGA4SA_3220 [Olavius algarvensis Delta 1 endosymbiont]|nr:hypothetical protein D1AOALGA4SA_3220 [Olavius algarvensis Delta 1 endosymbiont]